MNFFYYAIVSLFLTILAPVSVKADGVAFVPVRSVFLDSNVVQPFDALPIDSDVLCISSSEPSGLVFLQVPALKQIKKVSMTSAPSFLALNSVRREFYVLSAERPVIYVFDVRKMELLHLINLPSGAKPVQIVVENGGRRAFIGDGRKPLLYGVDLELKKADRNIHISAPVQRLLLSNESKTLYVGLQETNREEASSPTSEMRARVDIVNCSTMERIQSVQAKGVGVAGLAFDPAEQVLFVLSYHGAVLSIVRNGSAQSLEQGTPHLSAHMPGDRVRRGSGIIYDPLKDYLYVQSTGLNASWTSIVHSRTLQVLNRVVGGDGRMRLWRRKMATEYHLYSTDFSNNSLIIVDVGALPKSTRQ